jgi:predicted PurR-regulated permease PerM
VSVGEREPGRRASDNRTRSAILWIGLALAIAVWLLRDLALTVGYSVLLAYALLPVVNAIERIRFKGDRSIPRHAAAALVILALVGLVGWIIVLATPRIAEEASRFATGAPDTVARLLQGARAYAAEHELRPWLEPVIDSLSANAAGWVSNLGGIVVAAIGRLFGSLGLIFGFLLVPLLAFYLMADSDAVQESALSFLPEDMRAEVMRLGGAVDLALRSYVRGQAVVCVVMAVSVGPSLALMHLPGAILLGILVGLAELIPYIGFGLAATAIVLSGISVSPSLAVLGLTLYVVVNWVVGTFITPRVMGRYLKMHPFVVTVSVLAGAKLLGPAGALLALPGAAVIQALIGELAPADRRGAKR